MAKRGAADAWLLIAGRSFSPEIGSVTHKVSSVLEETNGLSRSWRENDAVGIRFAEVSHDGWYNDAAGSSNEAFNERQETSQVLAVGVSGTAIGAAFTGAAGDFVGEYSRVPSREALHRGAGTHRVSGQVDEGVTLHDESAVAETADGDTESSSVDEATAPHATSLPIATSSIANPTLITLVGGQHNLVTGDKVLIAGHVGSTPAVDGHHAVIVISPTTFTVPVNVTVGGTGGTAIRTENAGGGAGYVHVSTLVLGGFTSWDPTLRDSDDDVSFADITGGGFTVVTASPAAQRLAIAGAIRRHTALAWVFTGSGSGQSVKLFCGVARNP